MTDKEKFFNGTIKMLKDLYECYDLVEFHLDNDEDFMSLHERATRPPRGFTVELKFKERQRN